MVGGPFFELDTFARWRQITVKALESAIVADVHSPKSVIEGSTFGKWVLGGLMEDFAELIQSAADAMFMPWKIAIPHSTRIIS
jgi:hypothetical protein